MPNSITAVDVGTEEVLTAGMPLLGDVSQMSYNHTVVPRYSLNRKYLLLLVLSTDRLSMRAWISSSTQRLSHESGCLYCCSFLLQSVPGLSSQHKTRTHGQKSREEEIYPHINLVPFIIETTGRPGPHAIKFISYLMRDADNPPLAGTPGQPSKVCSTVPSPNNNSQPPLRDPQ